MKRFNQILAEALTENNVLTPEDLKVFQDAVENEGGALKDFLIESDVVTDKQIQIALSQKLGLEMIDFNSAEVDQEAVSEVPIKIAWYYKFLPIRKEEGVLTIATAEPVSVQVQDEIRMHLGYEVKVLLASEKQLEDAIKKFYGLASETIDKILTRETKRTARVVDNGQWIEDLDQQTNDPTISHLVNEIILEAYKKRATDIHIEPYRDKVRCRYRIDGALVDANLPQEVRHVLPEILSRIKILANLSITEKRLPQDGSAVVRTGDQQLDLRVSTIPTPRGESIVIRVLPTSVRLFSLEKLGFDKDDLDVFRSIIRKPHGILFMTGPTGSGKTTTLYACLNEINESSRKIVTIEDPVEYEMAGITQVQVNAKFDFTFSAGLRSVLRHDPDIIMVGEVRDLETAEIAIRTALTGHLVFSTLHTNDSASGVTRLVEMGLEPYLVSSSVEAFIAQRLIRLICPKCRVEDKNPAPGTREEIRTSLGLPSDAPITFYRGEGCDHCHRTGYFGRRAIYEILQIDDDIRPLILEKPRSNDIKHLAMRKGMVTLRQSGWKAVLEGVTTTDEVINVTTEDKFVHSRKKILMEPAALQEPDSFPKPISKSALPDKNSAEGLISSQDSRTYPRTSHPVKIRYRIVERADPSLGEIKTADIEYTGISEDLSAGGLSFSSQKSLPTGTLLEMKIHLSEDEKGVECLAKVCRVEEAQTHQDFRINIYFLDLTSADRNHINTFVADSSRDLSVR